MIKYVCDECKNRECMLEDIGHLDIIPTFCPYEAAYAADWEEKYE